MKYIIFILCYILYLITKEGKGVVGVESLPVGFPTPTFVSILEPLLFHAFLSNIV